MEEFIAPVVFDCPTVCDAPTVIVRKPLCIDLFCGLGGWADGFLAEGYGVVGFDIECHDYGTGGYPGQLVLQDVLTLDGRQFRKAAIIVASPPCQEFSYRAMPWKAAKALTPNEAGVCPPEWWELPEYRPPHKRKDGEAPCMNLQDMAEWATWKQKYPKPPPSLDLFNACFRIAREAGVPLVVENVKGAQPWVGRARANYGSFYLWGDIASVGGAIVAPRPKFGETLRAKRGGKRNPDGTDHGQGSWFAVADSKNRGSKNDGGSWFAISHNQDNGHPYGNNPVRGDGVDDWKRPGDELERPCKSGSNVQRWPQGSRHELPRAREDGQAGAVVSKSSTRKAASAQIAKIPLPLAQHIARIYRP